MRRPFAMKQFSVAHSEAALPVTSDACLFATLAEFQKANDILDVGCGTGILSLMLAQKYPSVKIHGIDIHMPSVIQAQQNAIQSPFSNRVTFSHGNFLDYEAQTPINGIICNPPFFENQLPSTDETRRLARHVESLTLTSLTARCARLLQPEGELFLLLPALAQNPILTCLHQNQFSIQSITTIQSNPLKQPHLIVVYAIKQLSSSKPMAANVKTIPFVHYDTNGQLSAAAADRLKDFYLTL